MLAGMLLRPSWERPQDTHQSEQASENTPFAAVHDIPEALPLLAWKRGTEELPPAMLQPSVLSSTCTKFHGGCH